MSAECPLIRQQDDQRGILQPGEKKTLTCECGATSEVTGGTDGAINTTGPRNCRKKFRESSSFRGKPVRE
jgi:hypothetical protein